MTSRRSAGRLGPGVRGVIVCAVAVLGLLIPAPAALALQKDPSLDFPPEVDPYTRGKTELVEALGYLSFGPFFWAEGHNTTDVETLLGKIPFLWVETAHFRIGSNLPDYEVAQNKIEREKIKEELKRLRKVSSKLKIKTSTRHIDRWLRLHLYALRLEELYETFCADFGVSETDFPTGPSDETKPGMGQGPYLGQQGKFLVLLMAGKSGLSRYTERYMEQPTNYPMRWYFKITGCMFYGISEEFFIGDFENDTALHCNVTSGVVLNFLNGYRGYEFNLPLWWQLGIASWYVRNLDERYPVFGVNTYDLRDWYRWQPRIRGRVRNDYYPAMEKVLGWKDRLALKEEHHMMMWSRVDYLMTLGKDKVAAYQRALTEPMPKDIYDWDKKAEILEERQVQALEACFGLTPEAFDEGWAEYVLKEYEKK